MLEGALASARVIIEQHVEAVDAIARHLLAHEYATGDQITAIMAVVYGKTLHQKARTISA